MTDSIIAEMTDQDLNRLNDKWLKVPYYSKRMSGWKILLEGQWHFGFVSRQQAEEAVGTFELNNKQL